MFGDVAFAQAPFAALGGKTLASSLTESAVATDSVFAPNVIRGGLQDESASAAASVISSFIAVATNIETVAASALQSVIATMRAERAETATGTDTPAFAASTLNATQAESATATDAQSAIATMLAAIAETATGSDESTSSILVTVAIAESASGSVTQSTTVAFVGSISELASGLDSYSKLKTLNVYPEGLQLTVSVGNVLVWSTIPTDQTPPDPNWQDIPS